MVPDAALLFLIEMSQSASLEPKFLGRHSPHETDTSISLAVSVADDSSDDEPEPPHAPNINGRVIATDVIILFIVLVILVFVILDY